MSPRRKEKRDAKRDRVARESRPVAQEPVEKYVKNIAAKTPAQGTYIDLIESKSVVIGYGPAGCGKTYLAVAKAVEALNKGMCERLIFSRPAVEAGEKLGFLPGDLNEKLDPYMRPIFDAMHDRFGAIRTKKLVENKTVEIAPVAFLRGRTLNNAYIVIDEAQNCTMMQLKMAITRLGRNSTMIFTGDPMQSDLPDGQSGFVKFVEKLSKVEEIGIVRLTAEDIVRHPLISKVLSAIE